MYSHSHARIRDLPSSKWKNIPSLTFMRVSLNESPAAQNPGIFIGFGPPYEYLTCWGPGLLRLGAIMSFGGYCVSRPGLLRLGAVVG